jgi:arylsulfatase A-like enzyme
VETINDRASMKKWIDGYDTGIRYVDDYVGRIVERLKAAGIYEDTAIIISADHGENQGELGIYGEHATADVATCRVPMIVRWPGVAPRGPASDLQYNVDLAPTLMDLLGGEHQPLWDGQSFAPALRGQSAEPRSEIVISQCAHVCQRSVRFSSADGTPWLYVRTYHEGFHLFPDEMLFDLKADPYEQHDVAQSQPDICRDAAARLSRWHDDQMAHIAERYPHDVVDPMRTVLAEGGPFHASTDPRITDLPDYIKRLRATGREEGAQALEKRYGHLLDAR